MAEQEFSSKNKSSLWWIQLCRWLWKIMGLLGTSVILPLLLELLKSGIATGSPLKWLVEQRLATLLVGCFLLFLAVLIFILSMFDQQPDHKSQGNRDSILRQLSLNYKRMKKFFLLDSAPLELKLVEIPDAVQNATHRLLGGSHQNTQPLPLENPITYNEVEHGLLILGDAGTGKSNFLVDLAQQSLERAKKDEKQPLPALLRLASWAIKEQPLQDWLADEFAEIYNVPQQLSKQWVQDGQIFPLLDGFDEMKGTKARVNCIKAINVYRRDHQVPLVVCSRTDEYETAVEQGAQRLTLQSAIMMPPLTPEQVDAHLTQAGEEFKGLHKALKKNPDLQELARTPLMLNILMATYRGVLTRRVSRESAELQKRVFTDFFERMVKEKGDSKHYPAEQTKQWLSWLARQMDHHNRVVFYLEHLQPDWLLPRQQRIYTWLAIWLPGIVIGILVSLVVNLFLNFSSSAVSLAFLQPALLGGFLGGLLSNITAKSLSWQSIPNHPHGSLKVKHIFTSLFMGLTYGLGFGLYLNPESYELNDWLRDGSIFGIVIGLSCWLLLSLQPLFFSLIPSKSPRQFWQAFHRLVPTLYGRWILLVTTVFGGAMGLSQGLSDGLQDGLKTGLGNELSTGLSVLVSRGLDSGLSYGFITVLISLILVRQAKEVYVVDQLDWSWRNILESLKARSHLRRAMQTAGGIAVLAGLSIGLGQVVSVGLRLGLIDGLSDTLSYMLRLGLINGLKLALAHGLGYGLTVGLNYWLLVGLFEGIKNERMEDKDRRVPNEGIRRSLRNSLMIGLISGSLIVVSIGPSGWLFYILSRGLDYGLNAGLSHGLSYGLSYGLSTGLNYGLIGLGHGLSKAWLVGCCVCLLAAASKGGLAALQHMVLRILLWRTDTFPLKVPLFLDDASRRILLHRVGGGYEFYHRLLQNYFADLKTASSLAVTTPSVPDSGAIS